MSGKNHVAVRESDASAEMTGPRGLYGDLNKVRSAGVAALSVLGR